jgi:hypothetical protein
MIAKIIDIIFTNLEECDMYVPECTTYHTQELTRGSKGCGIWYTEGF